MFLEPDPRRTKNTGQTWNPTAALSQPTVRLVKPSLSDPTLPADIRDDSSASELDDGKENWNKTVKDAAAIPPLPQSAKASEPGFPASSRDFGVSEAGLPTNEAPSLDLAEPRAPSATLLPNSSRETVTAPYQTVPELAWLRRNTSSGYYSQCSTLHASEITLAPKGARSQRASQATTLRTTPTPSWASLEPNDTLPPLLQIPKKRLRHKPASASLNSQASSRVRGTAGTQTDDTMTSEDIDTLPYPRRPFSGHLSTIASESDGRTESQHFSHWSYGSGVLTGDELSSAPLSPVNDSYRRRDSAPVESMVSSLAPEIQPTSGTQRTSIESPGDMTLGIFREESAVPQPLFRPHAGPSTVNQSKKKYDGPLPPIPPIPKNRDDDERADTVSEMTRHSLHQKRSGYSLRSKTSNTPGHSRQLSEISYADSEARFSTVSNSTSIFPTWAKRFYSGTAHLPSKLSLHSNSTDGNAPVRHQRGESSWTDHSITSRLGHTYSNAESEFEIAQESEEQKVEQVKTFAGHTAGFDGHIPRSFTATS
ncbi:uncharacterized protein MYCFIDRAFT_82500 [Pseudocercospora fijiensis CIRAD86]|uniref:Uncharacterized protein n=1 Tax=Pseudocercospora fijiensis (strain CIRAD86) TaxID=383855 RepID=M2Z7Q4_PSEFD|nr:uncharacterized protein MYCFIDRAFT_82500 [Pseudocercospora fijiensis CIRAD86]EME85775.1 hypothetical protein MYCFIDRAFT_82500 [Pseudocercospora fijiensis CIRAD86]